MRELLRWKLDNPGIVTARQWSPAQHNVPHTSDRQHQLLVIFNQVVDTAAKHSATTGGNQETVGQAFRLQFHSPAYPDPFYFSYNGMPVLGDTRVAAQQAVGDVLMGAVATRPATHCGHAVHLVANGIVSQQATIAARKAMSPGAFGVAVRSSMGRTYAAPCEFLRDTRSQCYDQLRRVLD